MSIIPIGFTSPPIVGPFFAERGSGDVNFYGFLMPEWIFYGINFVGCLVEYTLQALREPSLVTSRALGSYC